MHAHQFSSHCKEGRTYCKCLVQLIENPSSYIQIKTATLLVPDQMMLSARSIICIGYQQYMHSAVHLLKKNFAATKSYYFTCTVFKCWLVITFKLQSSHQAQMFIVNIQLPIQTSFCEKKKTPKSMDYKLNKYLFIDDTAYILVPGGSSVL